MTEQLEMPVLWDNPSFSIQDGNSSFSSGIEGLLMADPDICLNIKKKKGDPFLDITLKGTQKRVSFRMNDIGCGSTVVEKPEDMSEKIWVHFVQMYQRFLVLREPLCAERGREWAARKEAEEFIRQQTIKEIDAVIK